MKTKPTRHKESNTFKFQTFSERISKIDVVIFHKVPHRFEEDSENETYFSQSVQKWNVLNLTENWEKFRKEVTADGILTLPQILNQKEKIVSIFLNNIILQDNLSLQPVLELIVALAKDLRHEFYPYFGQILKELTNILNSKDPEILEWTFTCLAHLFKLLWRYLVKDLDKVLLELAPLLDNSRPEYVQEFSAQGFSFVSRKIKDRKKLFLLLLHCVQNNNEILNGCGQLLFETTHGIKGQFHSCAQEIFTTVFNSLFDQTLPQKLIFSLATVMVNTMTCNIEPKNSSMFFEVVCQVMTSIQNQKSTIDKERFESGLVKLLKLCDLVIDYKTGVHFTNPSPFITTLVTVLNEEQISNSVMEQVSVTSSKILLLGDVRLQQELASRLAIKVINIQNPDICLKFIENTTKASNFETLILPNFMKIIPRLTHTDTSQMEVDSVNINEYLLKTFLKIILNKASPTKSTIDWRNWRCYDLRLADSNICNYIIDRLNTGNEESLAAMIVIPHVNKLIGTYENLKIIINIIMSFSDELEDCVKLFHLFTAVECLSHCDWKIIEYCLNREHVLKIIKQLLPYAVSNNLIALRILDLLLNCINIYAVFKLDDGTVQHVFDNIGNNLYFYNSDHRLVSLGILISVANLSSNDIHGDVIQMLEMAKMAEQIPLTVQDFREKIKFLQKLKFTDDLELRYQKVILKYLLGVLYSNFKLLWDPVCELIADYADGMSTGEFWDVFYDRLKICSTRVEIPASAQARFNCEELNHYFNTISSPQGRVDHFNYRILLWRSMCLFSDLCEAKNRDLATLFLDFWNQECSSSSRRSAQKCNIKVKEETDVDPVKERHDGLLTRAQVSRLLSGQLALFSKFKNPKQVYREQEMYALYAELLTHKNPEIQKCALDCLLTYKLKYMLPYKEHLYGLVDELKFKDELLYFKVDTDAGLLQESDRSELMPFILRLVYSKMVSKVLSQRGGKGAAGQVRRSMVIKFLAGCHTEEMEIFMRMAFGNMDVFQTGDRTKLVQDVFDNVSLEQVIAPKKLQSSLNLVSVMMQHFGGLLDIKRQGYLLNIILYVGAYVSSIFNQREKVYQGYIASLRNLRTSALEALAMFFERFEYFPWCEDSIDSVFKSLIWPNVTKLPVEGIYSPTALLKLFIVWSRNPRYYKLLSRHAQDDLSLTPLPYIMKLLVSASAHASVKQAIMELLERLLTLREDTDMEVDEIGIQRVASAIEIDFVIPVNVEEIKKLNLKEDLNFGSCILVPHVAEIFEHLHNQLTKRKSFLTNTELVVLSRISELALNEKHCDSLLQLLIPLLIRRKKNREEFVLDTLTTICHLFKFVSQPDKYILSLSQLFGEITLVHGRKLLIEILNVISERDVRYVTLLSVIKDLNSWDARWIDQPNYDTRLDTFKRVAAMMNDGQISLELGLTIIYNCFYFLRQEKDLSLRDNASFCLKELCPALVRIFLDDKPNRNYIIESILTLIRSGIADSEEHVQLFSVSLLGVMVRECSDQHTVLSDLVILTNKTDEEVDFFENLQHLQVHRRLRALLKFSTCAKTMVKPPAPRTLTQFILPLSTQFLCCDKYAGKNSLVDAAIQCVGTVSRLLPWHQYEALLKFYLLKLRTKTDHQKQLVRVVIAILDSFHFDLSNAKEQPKSTANEHAPEETISSVKEDVQEVEASGEAEKTNDTCAEQEEEMLEAVMETDVVEEVEEVEHGMTDHGQKLALECELLLKPSVATHAYKEISGVLLDQMIRTIGQRTQADSSHKINKKHLGPDKDEEEILRVPIAVAVVKLLQRLPAAWLNLHLPKIFLRLCTFLKSRLESVRRVVRETMQQIMTSVGPKYLSTLLSEMTTILNKGFYSHVLIYTIHSVINSLQALLAPGDIDDSLHGILELCKEDIFGHVSDEKEVQKIQVKHKEARSTKSYHLLELLAKSVTSNCLTDLILPVKDILSTTHSHKIIVKCRECLRYISLGLTENTFINVEDLLVYLYGAASQSIPELVPQQRVVMNKPNPRQRPDTFLIPKEPRSRTGLLSAPVKQNRKTNAPVLVEFGLQVLISLLKKEKLKGQDYRPYLDPIIPVLTEALSCQHVKVTTLSLQCLYRLLGFDLPSLRANIETIISSIFSILHKFGAAGLSKGDNFDLVLAAFKNMSVLVRDIDYHTITTDQLKILILYCEQDLHDHSRQATAFTLLKSILKRKLSVPELKELMEKVCSLSITSEQDYVRLQARQLVLQFVMDYPLGKRIDDFITFFVSQLGYELESGRRSALDMLLCFVNKFPLGLLVKQCGMLMVALGARLVNDDSAELKKVTAGVIKSMLFKLDNKHRDQMFSVLDVWFGQKKVQHKRLAAQLAGIFVSVEKEVFKKRLPAVLDVIIRELSDKHKVPAGDSVQDHLQFQILQLLLKICTHCEEFLTCDDYVTYVNQLIEISQNLLCHEHEWIRLSSAQFIGYVLCSIPPGTVSQVLSLKHDKQQQQQQQPQSKGYFQQADTCEQRVRSLILDHCCQLIPGADISQQFLQQITKNLVYFAKVVKDVTTTDFSPGSCSISLQWLTRRMRKVVNMEIVQTPTVAILRESVFKWIGAVAVSLSKEELSPVLYHLIAPLVREREVAESDTKENVLLSLVNEVVSVVQKKVGLEDYSKCAVKLQTKLLEQRAKRKAKKTQEFVTDPEKAAKRKIQKQLKKKEFKKRKTEKVRGKTFKKKRNIDDVEIR